MTHNHTLTSDIQAGNASVLVMSAVMVGGEGALDEARLSARAGHIVEQDVSTALPKEGLAPRYSTCGGVKIWITTTEESP